MSFFLRRELKLKVFSDKSTTIFKQNKLLLGIIAFEITKQMLNELRYITVVQPDISFPRVIVSSGEMKIICILGFCLNLPFGQFC